jgi:condensin complex subunit 2
VAPFPTQFFNDDDDDVPGFEDPYDGGVIADGVLPAAIDDEQDLLASSQGPKPRVKPEFVNYAKRAKRVDVRKLKEKIWKGLDIIVPEPKEEEDMVINIHIGSVFLLTNSTSAG